MSSETRGSNRSCRHFTVLQPPSHDELPVMPRQINAKRSHSAYHRTPTYHSACFGLFLTAFLRISKHSEKSELGVFLLDLRLGPNSFLYNRQGMEESGVAILLLNLSPLLNSNRVIASVALFL